MKEKIKVIAFVGPTASGKSRLAMSIAEHMNTAIVCMDSMQIYRGMDIGTAKPTEEDRRKVSHYMIDIVDPDQNYTVADYAQNGAEAIKQIASEGKLPVLVGGTGLYLKALMHGFTLGGTKEDPILRAELNLMAQTEEGKRALHDRLHRVDPQSAQRLHPNDIRRVIRAIEVYEQGGIPASQLEP